MSSVYRINVIICGFVAFLILQYFTLVPFWRMLDCLIRVLDEQKILDFASFNSLFPSDHCFYCCRCGYGGLCLVFSGLFIPSNHGHRLASVHVISFSD